MKILITAGPTREPVDPVRFLSNRSSGKMGYALAESAVERDHDVLLITGPVSLSPPAGCRVQPVTTAAEMLQAVMEHVSWCEVLIMVAAVADWRPTSVSDKKIKKENATLMLELEPTEDILHAIQPLKGDRLFVGFAAETDHLLNEAERKLREKGLDLIVANDISDPDAGFDVETNKVYLLACNGQPKQLPCMLKHEVADHILMWIETKISSQTA